MISLGDYSDRPRATEKLSTSLGLEASIYGFAKARVCKT